MGSLTLPEAGLVYLDANGFIYSVERIEPYRTLLSPIWIAARKKQIEVVSSELSILETLVKPLRDADHTLVKVFRDLLYASEVQLAATTAPIWEQAAQLRAATGLKTPDAVHAATALAVGASLFVTNDPAFRRVDNLPVTVLSELMEAEEAEANAPDGENPS